MTHKLSNPYNPDFYMRKKRELDKMIRSKADLEPHRAAMVYIASMLAEHEGLAPQTQEQMSQAVGMTRRTFARNLAKARTKVSLP